MFLNHLPVSHQFYLHSQYLSFPDLWNLNRIHHPFSQMNLLLPDLYHLPYLICQNLWNPCLYLTPIPDHPVYDLYSDHQHQILFQIYLNPCPDQMIYLRYQSLLLIYQYPMMIHPSGLWNLKYLLNLTPDLFRFDWNYYLDFPVQMLSLDRYLPPQS